MQKIYLPARLGILPPLHHPFTTAIPVQFSVRHLWNSTQKRAELFNASRQSERAEPGVLSVLRVLWEESYLFSLSPHRTLCPPPSLTVMSLEGIARNMPEICVWQLAFDIQSCRASLTKRVTHTHPHTHIHANTHTHAHTDTDTPKEEDIRPVFNLFVIMFAHFLMLPFLYPVRSCLKWGIRNLCTCL